MILHLSTDNIFIDRAIENFEKAAPGKSIYLINTAEPKLIQHKEYITAEDPESEGYKKIIRKLADFDLVILHALTQEKIKIVNEAPEGTVFLWVFWGADGYAFRKMTRFLYSKRTMKILNKEVSSGQLLKRQVKNSFYHLFKHYSNIVHGKTLIEDERLKAANRIQYCAPVIDEDYFRLKKAIGFKAEYTPFNYGSIDIYAGMLGDAQTSGNNILIGNSADPANNHADIFEKLRELDLGSRKLYVPLSYSGNALYKEHILKTGKAYFGDNFHPLTSFIPKEEYTELVRSCNVVIMNHMRQQGGGNLLISLWFGSRIFMNPLSTLYKFYHKTGIHLNNTNELNQNNLDTELVQQQRLENRDILKSHFSAERSSQKVKNITDKFLNHK